MNVGWGGGVARVQVAFTGLGGEWRLPPGMASPASRNYHLPWLASAQLPDAGGPRAPKLCPGPSSIQGKYV